jgi:hypothetical protein
MPQKIVPVTVPNWKLDCDDHAARREEFLLTQGTEAQYRDFCATFCEKHNYHCQLESYPTKGMLFTPNARTC